MEGVLSLNAAADGAPGVVEGRVGERGGGDLHDTTARDRGSLSHLMYHYKIG